MADPITRLFSLGSKLKNLPEDKEKAINEIVRIIQDFQYNDELSEKYKREILDQDKIYD